MYLSLLPNFFFHFFHHSSFSLGNCCQGNTPLELTSKLCLWEGSPGPFPFEVGFMKHCPSRSALTPRADPGTCSWLLSLVSADQGLHDTLCATRDVGEGAIRDMSKESPSSPRAPTSPPTLHLELPRCHQSSCHGSSHLLGTSAGWQAVSGNSVV